MNKLVSLFLILIVAATVCFSAGCNKETTYETVEYQMQIDSITHADTITFGEDFTVYFYGPIGPNSCFGVSRFVPQFALNAMGFVVYGLETKRSDCSGSFQYMNGADATLSDLTPGDWTITVYEPEGISPIQSKVYIKE